MTYLERFAINNPIDLKHILGQLDYSLDSAKTFDTFLLLTRYIINYEAPVSTSSLESSYNNFARRFRFYETQIIEMEGKNLAYHARVVDAVKMGM